MTLRVRRPSRRIATRMVLLSDGPLAGERVLLDVDSGLSTLAIAPMKGWPAGRYVCGMWREL